MSPSNLEEKFQTLHEIVRTARLNLAPGPWDYLAGGAETETTLRRNRQALDSVAFRPRILRNVAKIDTTSSLLGRPVRIPVMIAPVGSVESFEPGGGATARLKALHGPDGCDHDRNANGPPEQARSGVDLRDVSQDPRAERDRVEGLSVAPQRGLGLGAAREIVPGARRQVQAGRPHDLVKRLKLLLEVRR